MTAYYSEFDPFAAQWLRNLIAAGHIAPGDVDERNLWDVHPDDLSGYTQVHLCAGIGVWSHALRLAGWPDDRPVWTASFPCQPFSAAGKGLGFADERHLWPAGLHLIRQHRPDAIFGEQVSSKDGLAWFDLVQADLEDAGYACGGLDTCAAGVGAPHIRQRLYWGAKRLEHVTIDGRQQRRAESSERGADAGRGDGGLADSHGGVAGNRDLQPGREHGLVAQDNGACGMAHTHDESQGGRGVFGPRQGDGSGVGASLERPARLRADGGLADSDQGQRGRWTGECGREQHGPDARRPEGDSRTAPCRAHDGLADSDDAGPQGRGALRERAGERPAGPRGVAGGRPGPADSFWGVADWLLCRDAKWRPVEPGTFPLADGAANRVGRLRGYGNALVAPQAQAFIEAWMDVAP